MKKGVVEWKWDSILPSQWLWNLAIAHNWFLYPNFLCANREWWRFYFKTKFSNCLQNQKSAKFVYFLGIDANFNIQSFVEHV